jgi:hypothetical protein
MSTCGSLNAEQITESVGAHLERAVGDSKTIGYVLVLAEIGPAGKIGRLRIESNGAGNAQVAKLLKLASDQMGQRVVSVAWETP